VDELERLGYFEVLDELECLIIQSWGGDTSLESSGYPVPHQVTERWRRIIKWVAVADLLI
jgi:hypothetical protein